MNYKINNLPTFDLITADVETTGLDSHQDEIIEIGAVKFKHNKVVDRFQSFINIGKKLPANIQTLTNISDEHISTAPSAKIVLNDFKDFIGAEKLCFHNARFDLEFLNYHLEKLTLPIIINEYYDTLEISRIFTPHFKSHSLENICKHFQIKSPQSHRADNDAQVTGKLFIELIKFICDNFDVNLLTHIETATSLVEFHTNLKEFISVIQSYLAKTSLQRPKKIKRAKSFFPNTNFISNLNSNETKPAAFVGDEILMHFEEEGSFPKNFEKYEFRQGQIDMAMSVAEAYKDGKKLIVEAGTGVGKSFAYLVPSIIFSKFAEQKIVISTNTKNLQEQLFYKDIPTLQRVTELTFNAALLKGRRNYLCLRKWHDIISNISGYLSQYETRELLKLFVWVSLTNTGDIEENHSFIPGKSGLWNKLASDGTSCYGRKCPRFEECFTMKIRRKAEKSNIVIINHSLLIADAVTENSVLGNYENLVIDEAHNLPQTAAIHFGFKISLQDIYTISRKILSKGEFQYGISKNIKANTVKSTIPEDRKKILKGFIDEWIDPLEELEAEAKEFFSALNKIVIDQGNYGKLRFKNLSIFKPVKNIIENINTDLAYLVKRANKITNFLEEINPEVFPYYEESVSDLQGIIELIFELQNKFKHLFSPDFENYAFWLETTDRTYKRAYFPHLYIICAPIEVNEDLNNFFWSKLETIIITSATLAIRSDFKFYKHLTGLDEVESKLLMEFIASSPFDYERQMKVLIPNFLPSPKDKFYSSQAISLIEEILSVHIRGTLTSFTSYKDLGKTYSSLVESFSNNNVMLLAQGKTGSRTSILESFRKEENSVLLGTKSFWEGVDVKGKSLEILILYRLPFLVPTEPLVEATLDKLTKAGKNSFMHYSLPISLLHFKQGFGRLIRNKTDNGVIIILDNRIIKKYYGRYFQKVIPVIPLQVISNLAMIDHITNWFEKNSIEKSSK